MLYRMMRLSRMIACVLYDDYGREDDDHARYCVLGESNAMVLGYGERRRDERAHVDSE